MSIFEKRRHALSIKQIAISQPVNVAHLNICVSLSPSLALCLFVPTALSLTSHELYKHGMDSCHLPVLELH